MYFQCKFSQGYMIQTAWIEERGARVGALIELKGEEGLWKVEEVNQPGRDAKWLQENSVKVKKDWNKLNNV